MWINLKSPLNLRDVCNQVDNIENDIYINMTEFSSEDYREILKHSKPITLTNWIIKENVTILDLFNIPFQKDIEIIDFIKKRTKIDITTNEWIEEINILFQKAIDIYENRYLRIMPFKIKKKKFNTTKTIIDFLRETKTNKTSWILNCAIAKVCFAVNDLVSNEKIRRAEFLDNQFINQYLDRPFQIEEWFTDESGNLYRKWRLSLNIKDTNDNYVKKVIDFKLISRQKSEESIIWKEIADPTYYSVMEFKDLVWATIYLDSNEEALFMMQFLDGIVYHWEWKIKNKNAISHKCISENINLNRDFRFKLFSSLDFSNERPSESETEYKERSKKGTTDKYREVKLVWDVELSLEEWQKSTTFPVGTEIKFVIWWHDNEEGISLQPIYDYIKRFRELTRMGLPIRKLDIVKYVNDFFDNIDSILKKKNKNKEEYYKELWTDLVELNYIDPNNELSLNNEKNDKIIALGLYKYFRNKLVKLKMSTSKKTYYSHDRSLKLRDLWMHKPHLQEI